MQIVWQMLWQMMTLVSAPVFWLVTGMVYWNLRRLAKQKDDMFQTGREPVLGRLVITMLAGLAGGLFASYLLLVLGVSVAQAGLGWLWILAALLMMIRQRFFCFAYAGGLLSGFVVITGWPDIHVSQILALVAVLHCTEAFLVLVCGAESALPVYLKTESGQITGGFLLQMTWPLPLIALFGISAGIQPQAGFFVFPAWWPLIGTKGAVAESSLYLLLPVLAALGYRDAAVYSSVEQKTRQSAVLLFGYSVCLLLLVILTGGKGLWQLIPAVFAPLGHELVIHYGKRFERAFGYLPYRNPEQGVGILDVMRGSPAWRAGLRKEDVIFSLNGLCMENRQRFLECQFSLPDTVLVEYQRRGRRKWCRMQMKSARHPGVIPMPDESCAIYWGLQEDEGFAKFLCEKCEKRLKKQR